MRFRRSLVIVSLGVGLSGSAAWARIPIHFTLSVGTQYSLYTSRVQLLANFDRKRAVLIPFRLEVGTYWVATPRLMAGVIFRTDIESNLNPFQTGGSLTYGMMGLNLSVRYLFPLVLGEKHTGTFVRMDLGMAGMGTTHVLYRGIPLGVDSYLGAGYLISVLNDQGAFMIEAGYSPRFLDLDFTHSIGITGGILF